MRTWAWGIVVYAAVAGGACGGHGGAGDRLNKLPASAGGVLVMNRVASEAETRDGLMALQALMPAEGMRIPGCASDTMAKIELAAVAASDVEPRVVVLASGKGLRAAFDACARTVLGTELTITDEGDVTTYKVKNDSAHVAWLDGDTVLGGPIEDARATAALRSSPPLSGNPTLAALMAKVDRATPLWVAVDTTQLATTLKGVVPPELEVRQLMAKIGGAWEVTLVIDASDAAHADKIVAEINSAVKNMPIGGDAEFAKSVKIETKGAEVTVHADVAALMQQTAPGKPLPKTVSAISLLGIGAAIAIPAFTKNARRAKTIEATVNLKKLYDGARIYYEEDAVNQGGAVHFPASVGPTPPLGTCCKQPNKKCQPDPTLWSDPSWQALKFSMDDPYYYSYQYTRGGEGENAAFTVNAFGDLDCNGVYSTFEMVGKVEKDGTITAGGLFKDKQLE